MRSLRIKESVLNILIIISVFSQIQIGTSEKSRVRVREETQPQEKCHGIFKCRIVSMFPQINKTNQITLKSQ